jgi:drug/metabolite transporter (DMT)-like permease
LQAEKNDMSKRKQFIPIILLIALALIWGSSFILMKNGLKVYSAAQVATMRMFFSFIFLLPLTISNFKKIPLKYFGIITLVGLLGNGLPAVLFANAQTKLSSSTAGVLNSLTPLFTLIIAVAFFKQHFSSTKITGIIIGMIGAIVLIMFKGNGSIETNYQYGSYIFLATLCYAWSVNLIKNYLHELPAIAISSMALFIIGPLYGYYLFAHTDFIFKTMHDGSAHQALVYILLLALFGTAISLVLFNKLVQLTTPVYAASVTYLIPIVALFWGFLDGEPISFIQIIGLLGILIGVYLANKNYSKA